MNRGHHLSARIEGDLADTDELIFLNVLGKSQLFRVIDESALRRLADSSSRLCIKLRVGAKRHGKSDESFVVAEVIHYGHLVLGKSTRFVGADYLRTAESFNCRKLTDYRVTLRHICNAQGKNDRNDCCESLGDRRYRKGYGDHKRIENRLKSYSVTEKLNCKYYYAYTDNDICEYLGKTCKLDLQRSFSLFCLSKSVCDLAHFRIHARRCDYRFTSSVNNGRAHKHHIFAVAQGYVSVCIGGKGGYSFFYRYGFTRKRGFLYFHRSTFDDTRVRGNCVARFKQDDIADYQVFAWNEYLFSVAEHLALRF